MTRRGGLLSTALALLGAVLLCPPARAQEDCASCHEDVAKAWGKSTHGKHFAADATLSGSCTSCHVGGAQHASSGGEAKVLNPKKGLAREANAGCLTCHESTPAQAHWPGSAHERAGLKCASCHEVHGQRPGAPQSPKGLPGVTAATAKCLECHGGERQGLLQRSGHPLRDGQMGCESCHNPHGSAAEKLLKRASVNELCYSCHQEKRGPFLWEHSPVREDCLTCHKQHGSNNPSLLQARVTQLCQSCHQQGRHQTIPGVPPSVWVSNKACLNCHSQVHGTNHPSGPLFQR